MRGIQTCNRLDCTENNHMRKDFMKNNKECPRNAVEISPCLRKYSSFQGKLKLKLLRG